MAAGEETSLQVRLRKEYDRPTGAVAHLTVRGGKQASRGVSIRTRRSEPWVISPVAWVGRRPRSRIRVHCVAGIQRAEPCEGRIWFSTKRPIIFGFGFKISHTRRFAIGVGRSRSLSIHLIRGVRKGEKRRMLRAYVWIESIENTRTDITLRSKVPRR